MKKMIPFAFIGGKPALGGTKTATALKGRFTNARRMLSGHATRGWRFLQRTARQPAGLVCSLGAVLAIEGVPHGGNMLQNANFQSDWISLMPKSHTLTWCYVPDYFNRRDYNPDAWWCKGNWQWNNADGLPGERRLMLQGTGTEIAQSVNWALIFDDTVLPPNNQIADDGGFPLAQTAISDRPLSMVRDLTLTVRFRGTSVPAGAGSMIAQMVSTSSTVTASAPWPAGTYDWQTMSIKLTAADWLAGTPSPGGSKRVLPMLAKARFTYNNAAGAIELGRAELSEAGPVSPNLLSNGSFEDVDEIQYPTGWSAPEKFRRFPLKLFYLFQSWHNALSDNRGPVTTDTTVVHSGSRSLKMIMPSGDEQMVVSDPVVLNQATNRLIEVQAWIRTDRVAMLHIGAVDQDGTVIPGYNIIQKAKVSGIPVTAYTSPYQFSILADSEWFLMRQVLRPKTPVQSLRLQLCTRSVNGYTLEDTSEQPQNNSTGHLWWDDVRVYEPESTAAELAARGVSRGINTYVTPGIQIRDLNLGERLLGANRLQAAIHNPDATQPFRLRWRFTSPAGTTSSFESDPQMVSRGGQTPFQIPYIITNTTAAYTEYHGVLDVLNYAGLPVASNELWFSTWTTPIDIQLGALYAPPDYTNQLVRMNFGLSTLTLNELQKIRIEIHRRATDTEIHAVEFVATSASLTARHDRIPAEVYDDCRALELKDLDISMLPIQPFDNPERQWVVRVKALDAGGAILAQADSAPFCRQAHDAPQPGITNVTITTNGLLLADGQPWMPWGRIYQNVPTYKGPAEGTTNGFRNLRNLPAWNLYGWRFGLETNSRQQDDFTTKRWYSSKQTPEATLINEWSSDNIMAATAFAFGYPVYSTNAMFTKMGGKAAADAYLDWAATAPMIASIGPGIEENFSEFVVRTPAEINGLRQVVEYLRDRTGKPIMASHGGYWNRFEFETIDFFDIFDPETEPLFPANLHTDIRPFAEGKNKTIWLRPQMYEHVPYERWRFHTYVELMRGCRGWQMAHGPGDLSLYRGLHGELEYLKPAAFSSDLGPWVAITPPMEHWVRRANGKTTIIAATTRGLTTGRFRWDDNHPSPVGRSRVTTGRSEARNEDQSYCMGLEKLPIGPSLHGINHMPDSRVWPEGSSLVQWLYLDPAAPPSNLVFLVKADGRWKHGATWGSIDPDFSATPDRQEWFIRMLYKQAAGFAFAGGWGALLYENNKQYTMTNGVNKGAMPAAGVWHKIELPLADLGITTQMVDGVAFIHAETGRVWWSHTLLTNANGECSYLFKDAVEQPADKLARTRIDVEGLTNGTPVRVLFEDRTITAKDGWFEDDFRGQDVYQRFGGDFGLGYGAAPVALHIYEVNGL